MKTTTPNYKHLLALVFTACAALLILLPQSMNAQTTPPSTTPTPPSTTPDETSQTESEKEKEKEKIILLDKFQVSEENSVGYAAKNAISNLGRVATPILDTPQSIQIVNHDVITDLGVDTITDALKIVVPGISQRSFNGDDKMIWGFRAGAGLKDGFLVYNGGGSVGALYDVDRVEVIKGPIAMTYGNAGFVSGAINYVTRQPTRTQQTEVEAEVGTYNSYKGVLHNSGPITDNLLYRIDVGGRTTDYSERRFGFYRDKYVSAALDYYFSDTTKIKVDAALWEPSYNYPFTFIDPTTEKVFAGPADFTTIPSGTHYGQKYSRITAELDSVLSEGFTFSMFFGYLNNHLAWHDVYIVGYDPATHIAQRAGEDYIAPAHSLVFDVDFTKLFNTGQVAHTMQFGANATWQISSYEDDSLAITPDLNVLNPGNGGTWGTVYGQGNDPFSGLYDDSRNRTASIYWQDTANLFKDRVYLVGGLRFNDFIQDSPDAAKQVYADNKTVYRYGIVVKPTKELSVYANKSESFTFTNTKDYLGRPFIPELGIDTEFGVKGEFMDGRLMFTATKFELVFTHVPTFFLQGPNDPKPGQQGKVQGGTQHNPGYEFVLSFMQPVPGGNITFTANHYHGNITDENHLRPNASVNDTSGLLAKYSITADALRGLSLGLGIEHEGNQIGAAGDDGIHPVFPPYTTYYVFATYHRGNLTYQLNVNNLTNERFIAGSETPLWIFTDPGRVIKFSTTYKF